MSKIKKRWQEAIEAAKMGGGIKRIESQHEKGKMTARERIAYFLDPGSFHELDQLVVHRISDFGMENKRITGDGVVTGSGQVNGQLVYVFAQDFTVFGGTLSETNAQKICKVMDLALQNKKPIIGLNDSGGARIQEGVASLGGYANIFYRNVQCSGVIPQISAILGPCAGGAVYSPAMTDLVFMAENTSYMFLTGPEVVKTVTNEEVSTDDLGGAKTHAIKTGIAHHVSKSDAQCLDDIRTILSYIPANNQTRVEDLPYTVSDEVRPKLNDVIPESPNLPYDMHTVIEAILDQGSFFEIQASYAENILVGFGRIAGMSIGIVANQPANLAGVLDVDASKKGGRFVRFCDAFNIPLVVLEDVPGFLPGTDQEWKGIITEGAKLLYAFSEATVPRITIITRKAYGGAYCVMNSKHIGADFNFAWPSAEVAVMGAKGAAKIIFRNDIASSDEPEKMAKEKEELYNDLFANPFKAAELGYIDGVIQPSDTRRVIIRCLKELKDKTVLRPVRKHGNIPL